MHALALAESGWVWDGTGSWLAGLWPGRARLGLRRTRPRRTPRRRAKGGRAVPSLSPSLNLRVSAEKRCPQEMREGSLPDCQDPKGLGERSE